MISTEAWVLPAGPDGMDPRAPEPAELRRESFTLPEPGPGDVLVEPIYGCWEANLDHALARDPIDICRQRGEDRVVLGNAGVARVLRPGPDVTGLAEGDLCLVTPFGELDPHGYVELVFGYDAPGTVGMLAKQAVMPAHVLVPLPKDSGYSARRWAAFGRYHTAWDNWKVAYACWRSQMELDGAAGAVPPLAFGWGGGVVFAELELAKEAGFRVAMATGNQKRIDQLEAHGITPVDRRLFPDLHYDAERAGDKEYRQRYKQSEDAFLQAIAELSDGQGVAIFLDNIGGPVYRPTTKALARQGVLSTVGWKAGMKLWNLRASECIGRHLHVHTHVWRFGDSPRIRDYQERTGWLAPVDGEQVYGFDQVPDLAADFATGTLDTYFPLYEVNPL
jgi:hypothetical protein